MAKTKLQWIEEINAFGQEAIGDITSEQLSEMTISQLKSLKSEIESELKEEGKEVLPVPSKEAEGKFSSMCGSEFDPKASGSCHKQCSQDFPEAFKACSENFKTLANVGKPAKARLAGKGGGGKTIWNHIVNSQAGKIDECIISGKPMSLKEIADYANGKELRTLAHMKHLVFDWNIEILIFKHKEEDGTEKDMYFWSDKDKRRKGEKLAGKSAYKTA